MASFLTEFGRDLDDVDAPGPGPMELLQMWLPPFVDEGRPVMVLSTTGADGFPNSRNVLLSDVERRGLHFHTDARSRKYAELRADNRACAVLTWLDASRQVVVQGRAVELTVQEAGPAYVARSEYLQLLAWVNDETVARLPVAGRRRVWADFMAQHGTPAQSMGPPPTWAGFCLEPTRMTFWRGDADGPSNRVEYVSSGDAWTSQPLPG